MAYSIAMLASSSGMPAACWNFLAVVQGWCCFGLTDCAQSGAKVPADQSSDCLCLVLLHPRLCAVKSAIVATSALHHPQYPVTYFWSLPFGSWAGHLLAFIKGFLEAPTVVCGP